MSVSVFSCAQSKRGAPRDIPRVDIRAVIQQQSDHGEVIHLRGFREGRFEGDAGCDSRHVPRARSTGSPLRVDRPRRRPPAPTRPQRCGCPHPRRLPASNRAVEPRPTPRHPLPSSSARAPCRELEGRRASIPLRASATIRSRQSVSAISHRLIAEILDLSRTDKTTMAVAQSRARIIHNKPVQSRRYSSTGDPVAGTPRVQARSVCSQTMRAVNSVDAVASTTPKSVMRSAQASPRRSQDAAQSELGRCRGGHRSESDSRTAGRLDRRGRAARNRLERIHWKTSPESSMLSRVSMNARRRTREKIPAGCGSFSRGGCDLVKKPSRIAHRTRAVERIAGIGVARHRDRGRHHGF